MRRGHTRASKAPTPSFDPMASGANTRRDSDASSLCSSRSNNPSASASALLSDRSSQSNALRSINAYLSSHSASFSLKPPLPSARDITDSLCFLLSRLNYPLSPNSNLDDVLLPFLKLLGCPLKLTRSALRAPGTPHAWPSIVSLLHWLVQLARYADIQSSPTPDPANDFLSYVARSYGHFICGDDDAVADLDQEYLAKAEHQASNAAASVDALAKEAEDLEAKLSALRAAPSKKEALERERDVLAEDVRKFQLVVENWDNRVAAMREKLRDWQEELQAKETENRRMCEENEALRRRVEGQAVGVRDAERMRKEMQAVERDAAEAEVGRNAMEEKAWELEAEIGRKLKDLEAVAEQSNQAMRKLKLGSDLQYVLNAEGSTPAEVLGIDYKTTIKPALATLSEDTKQTSVSKLEELIALQQQSRDNATILEEKRACLAALQAKVDEDEARFILLKKEIEDHASKCATEAEKLIEEFTQKEHQLSIVEKEAQEFLKSSEQKLLDATRESDEGIQLCAGELLKIIDAVSEYKEYMESVTFEIKTEVAELAKFLGDACRASAVLMVGASGCPNASLKRARDHSPNSSLSN